VTHALIPTFSLPGTSIGTSEAQAFLDALESGTSRYQYSKKLEHQGLSENYAQHLDRMLKVYQLRVVAFFPKLDCRSILKINLHCLQQNINCIYCTRYNALFFKGRKTGCQFSHNIMPRNGPFLELNSS